MNLKKFKSRKLRFLFSLGSDQKNLDHFVLMCAYHILGLPLVSTHSKSCHKTSILSLIVWYMARLEFGLTKKQRFFCPKGQASPHGIHFVNSTVFLNLVWGMQFWINCKVIKHSTLKVTSNSN